MKFVFRADASRVVGVGHVMRTLTLAAEAIQQGHAAELHARILPPMLLERARRLGVDIVEVTAEGPPDEALGLVEAGGDVICLDGYEFTSTFIESLRSARVVLMAIDDNREMPLDQIDVILNQNPHANPEMYRDLRPRQLLVGPRFALVRDEVTTLDPRRTVRSKATRITVSMGGTDVGGLTRSLLEKLIDETDLAVDVALGVDSPSAQTCRAFVAAHIDRATEVQAADLPTALARNDLALLAAGSTLWEAAALGVPTVAVVVAGNQLASASAAANRGILLLSDARNGCDLAEVAGCVTTLASDRDRRRRMSRAGRTMIDGQGRTRVIRAIEALTHYIARSGNESHDAVALITLRALVPEDQERILRWRNQPEIASQMYTDHAITPAEHTSWFQRAIKDAPDHVFRIVDAGADPIGLVSLTDIDDGSCTWGGYIGDLDWHGRGAGTAALSLSLDLAFARMQLDCVLVEVLSTNERATEVYPRLGFEERKDARKVVMKSGGYSDVIGLVLSRERWAATNPPVQRALEQRGLI